MSTSPPKPFSIDMQQLKRSSQKIHLLLLQSKSASKLVRSMRITDNPNLTVEQREESFDKIISKFDSAHQRGKENSIDLPKRVDKYGKESPVMTQRVQTHLKCNTQDTTQSTHTERVKNNLTKLRNHYCFLPDISGLKKKRPTLQTEQGDDYQKFEKKSEHVVRLENGERKPLGFLKIGKQKYQKSMVLLNK